MPPMPARCEQEWRGAGGISSRAAAWCDACTGGDDKVEGGKSVFIIDRTEDDEYRMLKVVFQNDSDLKV